MPGETQPGQTPADGRKRGDADGHGSRVDHYAGQQQLTANLVASWVANLVALVIGFLMPRLIHDSVGLVALGIWDLGWSLLTYLSLAGVGLASAVAHYVARSRSRDSAAEVRVSIATGYALQIPIALCAAAACIVILTALPVMMEPAAAAELAIIPPIALCLALAAACTVIGEIGQGILRAHHRSGANELLSVGADIVLAISMIIVVMAGEGILGLAVVTAANRFAFEVLRLILVARTCPELTLSPQAWRRERAQELLRFTTKTSVGVMQDFLLQQISRLLLMVSAGPIALACYSRYATLVRQLARTVDRFTVVVPPITGSLMTAGQRRRLPDFALRASSAVLMATLPAAIVFGTFGDEIVTIWMGADLTIPGLAWVLAGTALMHTDRHVINQVLVGMNSHGRIALICLGLSTVIYLGLLALLAPLDPLRTAVLLTVTMAAGVFLPHLIMSSQKLGLGPLAYLRAVYLRPLLCNSVLLAGLLTSRELLQTGALVSALSIATASFAILGGLYWHMAFDDRMRRRFAATLRWRPG